MKVWWTAIAMLGLTPAALLAQTGATTVLSPGETAATHGAASVPLPPGAAYEWTERSPMGCSVTFKARNGGTRGIDIVWTLSRVRTRLGKWRSMHGGAGKASERWYHSVASGRTVSEVRSLSLACNAKRRYDIAIRKKQSAHQHYYPSSRSFTQRTTIDLGDLSRFFP